MIYPKLNPSKCKYPERKDCNTDENNHRCEFMKYDYKIGDIVVFKKEGKLMEGAIKSIQGDKIEIADNSTPKDHLAGLAAVNMILSFFMFSKLKTGRRHI